MRYLVVDISTTAQHGIEDSAYLSWANKKGSLTPEEAYSKAGLHAEYGMICGLSAYWVKFPADVETNWSYGIDEAMSETADSREEEEYILNQLAGFLDGEDVMIVGHNAKDFIIPFITKRYLGNGIRVPDGLLAAIYDDCFIDLMKELACGGVSVMSLRAAAWLFGIKDPRAGVAAPRFYQLCQDGNYEEVERLTRVNAEVAAKVFGNCVLGGLIKI